MPAHVATNIQLALKKQHDEKIALMDANALTYEEALAAAEAAATEKATAQVRQQGSPVQVRPRLLSKDGPACLVPTIPDGGGARDVDDDEIGNDEEPCDIDHYLNAQSPHEEGDWHIHKLKGAGNADLPANSVLPPQQISGRHELIMTSPNGQPIALQQLDLDERAYEPPAAASGAHR